MTGGDPDRVPGAADGSGERFGIGEVVTRLEPEFPDVTVSKVRFLESQGLVAPERTETGYRRFCEDDVARLVWILRQQRDHFLPLKVIRAILDESGGQPPAPSEEEVRPFREQGAALAGSVSVTMAELSEASGVDLDTLRVLEEAGLIEGHPVGSTAVYDDDALLVARSASTCIDLGLDVRHLRMYLVAAQREAGVLEQILLPRLRGDDRASLAAVRAQLDELVEAGGQIRDIMRRRSMGRLGRLTH